MLPNFRAFSGSIAKVCDNAAHSRDSPSMLRRLYSFAQVQLSKAFASLSHEVSVARHAACSFDLHSSQRMRRALCCSCWRLARRVGVENAHALITPPGKQRSLCPAEMASNGPPRTTEGDRHLAHGAEAAEQLSTSSPGCSTAVHYRWVRAHLVRPCVDPPVAQKISLTQDVSLCSSRHGP